MILKKLKSSRLFCVERDLPPPIKIDFGGAAFMLTGCLIKTYPQMNGNLA
jgi:hypothetical protein